jgi:copper chaperone CopZ
VPVLNAKGSLVAGFLAAIGASVCCVGPLLLLGVGIGGAWIGTLTAFEPYWPLFIGLTPLFLGLAFHKLYLLNLAQLHVSLPPYLVVRAQAGGTQCLPTNAAGSPPEPALECFGRGRGRQVFVSHFMTCELCPITVKTALDKVPGVATTKIELGKKTATVKFDPDRATVETLVMAMTNAGYPSMAHN